MSDEDRDLLQEMLGRAVRARMFLGTAGVAELAADEQKALVILHTLQIVGEAANHVSIATQRSMPDVPWTDIIGLRHRIVHDYRSIQYDVIVKTVRQSIPELIDVLQRALGNDTP